MKKSLLLSIVFCVLLAGCTKKDATITKLSMLEGGKVFAVPSGTAADQLVLKRFPDAKIIYFNSIMDCALAVKEGKADASAYDKPVLQNLNAKIDGLSVLDELLMDDHYGFAVRMKNTDLKKAMDEVLAELKSDGTYESMSKRWFPEKGAPEPMPDIKLTGENGVLRFGTAAVTEPMSYVDENRKVVGFDVEYATYIARKLGKKLEIINMEFGAMLPALISGKVDVVGAGMSITEERAKSVLFSKSYYPSGIAAIVRKAVAVPEKTKGLKLHSAKDLNDKRIGVLLGSIHENYAMKNQPQATIMQYQNVSDMLTALNRNKIDAAYFDQACLMEVLPKNKSLGILEKDVFTVPIAAAFNENQDELRQKFNEFLQQIKSNGTYDDMVDRWTIKGLKVMPDLPSNSTKGELRVGIVSDIGMPFTLISNGKLIGFDVELPMRFAAFLGKKFVPVDIQFGSMLASLSTNKIDMTTCSMMITEERERQVDFSDPYFTSGVSVIARKENIAPMADKKNLSKGSGDVPENKDKTFFQTISESFYNNIILENRYKLILNGLGVTVLISLLAALLGTLIGGLVCFMRMSKRTILSGTAKIYITLLRGTPVLVLLMIIFYVVFASVNINPIVVAIIAFGLNFAAYVSEMFRTSIEGVDKGQEEAGIAGGFTKIQTFLHIVLPQATRRILPVYKGEFISLVKMTSIVGYIAVQDVTRASDIIRSRTFDAFFPLIMAAVLYLLLAWLLTWALDQVEISVDPKRKRIQRMEETTL